MRKLGLTLALVALGIACKTAPETSPPGASSPASTATEAPAPIPTPPATSAPAPAATPPSAPAASGPRTYPESTTSIEAKVGEKFSVALPANITVPYKWRLEPAPDPKVLAVGEETYISEPPAGCQGCAGYGGTRLFAFTAAGAGKVELHFALRPLNEPKGAAQKEARIAVSVR